MTIKTAFSLLLLFLHTFHQPSCLKLFNANSLNCYWYACIIRQTYSKIKVASSLSIFFGNKQEILWISRSLLPKVHWQSPENFQFFHSISSLVTVTNSERYIIFYQHSREKVHEYTWTEYNHQFSITYL